MKLSRELKTEIRLIRDKHFKCKPIEKTCGTKRNGK